jgi:pantoate--beta-alanine ligase
MQLVHTRAELADRLAGTSPERRAVVMTMGALHEGHLSLVRRARAEVGPGGLVEATIFVNPLQFGDPGDLARYPRTLDADLAKLESSGTDLVYAPDVADMYPAPVTVTIDPGRLGSELEGALRPGHFAGMLTVVAKLLIRTAAGVAVFGAKDYQQVVLIRAMVADLDLGVSIVGAPILRDPDGLALSSRNRFLDPAQRARALGLSRALSAAQAAAAAGEAAPGVLAAAGDVLAAHDVDVDYLELRSPDLGPAPAHGDARLLVAAAFGRTRLIDNGRVTFV